MLRSCLLYRVYAAADRLEYDLACDSMRLGERHNDRSGNGGAAAAVREFLRHIDGCELLELSNETACVGPTRSPRFRQAPTSIPMPLDSLPRKPAV